MSIIRKYNLGNSVSVLVIVAALGTSCPVYAQDSEGFSGVDGASGPIIVTARNREESLQVVPASISALSTEDLERRSIQGIEGIELSAPAFTFDTLGSTQVRAAIRGIGTDEPGPGGEPSAAVFLDGIYLQMPGMATVDIFDIGRVEILRGPQGTLLGKNVVGGGINIIPNHPVDYFEGMGRVTIGNYGQLDFEGMVNLPLSDNWAQRLAFSRRHNNGFAENVTTGNRLEDINRFSFRYSIAGDLSPAISADLTIDYTDDDGNGRNNQIIGSTAGAGRAPVWDLLAADIDDIRLESDESDDFARRETYGARLQFDADLGFATLTSLSSFRHLRDDTIDGDDGHTFEQLRVAADQLDNRSADYGFGTGNNLDVWSTELRLGGTAGVVDWMIGGFLSETTYDSTAAFPITTFDCRASNPNYTVGLVDGVDGCNTVSYNDRWNLDGSTTNFAMFGDLTLHITENLAVSGGLRYSHDSKDFHATNARSLTDGFSALAVGSEIFDTSDSQSWDQLTWRASLEYSPTDDLFFYALAASGYKAGAYQTFARAASEVRSPLNQETATNYEVGVKADFFDNHLRVNLSAFMMDYQGLQSVSFSVNSSSAGQAASARIEGVEVETQLALTDDLIAGFTYAYLSTDVDGLILGGAVQPDNLRLQRAPRHDLSASLRYEQDIGEYGSIEYGGIYSYRSRIFDDPDNNLGEIRPPREIVNLYVNWENDSRDLAARLFVNNLFNEVYYNRISDTFGATAVTLGAPRQFGVSVTKRF